MPVRQIPKSHVSITGRHASAKSEGHADFESLLEADHLILLDFALDVRAYEAQPVRIPVPAKRTSYVPDALVHFHPGADGSTRPSELTEVKPAELLKKHRADYAPKFAAARAYAEERGWAFVLKTEQHIRTPRLANLKFLRRYRALDVDPADAAWITKHLSAAGGRCAETQLLDPCIIGEDERLRLLPVLWHMVITAQLVADLDQPITGDSLIALPPISL